MKMALRVDSFGHELFFLPPWGARCYKVTPWVDPGTYFFSSQIPTLTWKLIYGLFWGFTGSFIGKFREERKYASEKWEFYRRITAKILFFDDPVIFTGKKDGILVGNFEKDRDQLFFVKNYFFIFCVGEKKVEILKGVLPQLALST